MMKPSERMIRQYGEAGSKIPGSKYLRAYCAGCHEPIRVAKVAKTKEGEVLNSLCADCWPGDDDKPTPQGRPSQLPTND